MNREEFINYMNHPEFLDKGSINDMRELVHEFPYFQTGHLLFLKNLHLLDNIKFPSQLKISAAHITDREVLYHLLQEKQSGTQPEQETFDQSGTEIDTSLEKDAVGTEQENQQVINQEKEPDHIPPESVQSEHSRDDLADQILKRMQEIKEEKDHLPSSETASTEDESQTTLNEKTPDPELEDEVEISPSKTETTPDDPFILMDNEEDLDQDETVDLDDSGIKFSQSNTFSMIGDLLEFEYARDLDDREILTETDISTDPDGLQIVDESKENGSTNITSTERYSFVVWLDRIREEEPIRKFDEPLGTESQPGTSTDLIENFLNSDQRIISSPELDEGQEDISVPSVTEDEGLITDTLAQIYIKQGYYSKAIYAYEKLSLKFPEKSRYFASQIEKIKKIINKL